MSISKCVEFRERYLRGWYEMDAELLLSSVAPDFIFDDPAEPEPVTRAMLPDYMQRWDRRMRAAGGNNQWTLTHESRRHEDGLLIDWEWWQVSGSDLQGAAVVLTSDHGVLLERITYFDRKIRHSATSTWSAFVNLKNFQFSPGHVVLQGFVNRGIDRRLLVLL
jgi:hypothetical protein